MELPDCPPGTEGYQDSVTEIAKKEDKSCTKAEAEFQEHIKSLKIQTEEGPRCLTDRQERDAGGQWVYLCYPCGVQCAGETVMQTHLTGKKHKTRLGHMKVWPMSIFKSHPYFSKPQSKEVATIKKGSSVISTNENVNDLEEMYKHLRLKECKIQKTLDEVKAPMIGLEYLVEFPSGDEKCFTYMCLLCQINGHPRTIVDHYTSFKHRLSYFRYHFTKALELLAPYHYHRQYHNGVGVVVYRLAQRVEDKFGRQRPLCIEKELFDSEKNKISQWVAKGYHFSERDGSTFEEVIDINLIRSLDTTVSEKDKEQNLRPAAPSKRDPSPPKVNAPTRPKPLPQRASRAGSVDSLSDISIEENEPRRPLRPYRNQRSPHTREQRYNPYHKKQWNSPPRMNYIDKRQQELKDKKERDDPKIEYKRKMAIEKTAVAEEAAKKILAYHEKNPEKHPLYPEEWKKFWNRRYKELQADGKDPSKHDFKPEWIVFWTNRMKELHEEELRVNVNEIYRKFGISPPSRQKSDTYRPSEEPRRLSPEARHRSPEVRHRSPAGRYRSPEGRRRSPGPRRRSPERHRSPLPHRRSPLPHRRSPLPRRRSPPGDKKFEMRKRSRSPIDKPKPTRSSNPCIELPSLRRSQSPLSLREPNLRNRSPLPPVHMQTVVISDEELKPDEGFSPWHSDNSFDSLGSLPDARSPIHRPMSRTNSTVSKNSHRQSNTRSAPYAPRHENINLDIPPEAVPTLRLLVALEDHLGSLGPKIVDLLTTALKMEKEKPNSSEELLDREDAVALLETAKEKLKGVTQAGLVSGAAANALRSAVVRVAALLHEADTRAKQAKDKEKTTGALQAKATAAVSVAGVGAVDKNQIAQQMAEALIAQGKTDVSPEELAQLVDAVVGMAEAKKRAAEEASRNAALSSVLAAAPAPVAVSSSAVTPSASALQLLQSAYNENEKKGEIDTAITDAIDGLSDSDLETLLKNFNELSAEEQHSLIAYLKKLEAKEPRRVERLREYVSAAAAAAPLPQCAPEPESAPTVTAPVVISSSSPDPIVINPTPKVADHNPSAHKSPTPTPPTVNIESDDDDYTVEEVIKSANEKEKVGEEKKSNNSMLNDLAQFFPANLSSTADLLALVQAAVQGKPQASQYNVTASVDTNTKPISFGDVPELPQALSTASPSDLMDSISEESWPSERPLHTQPIPSHIRSVAPNVPNQQQAAPQQQPLLHHPPSFQQRPMHQEMSYQQQPQFLQAPMQQQLSQQRPQFQQQALTQQQPSRQQQQPPLQQQLSHQQRPQFQQQSPMQQQPLHQRPQFQQQTTMQQQPPHQQRSQFQHKSPNQQQQSHFPQLPIQQRQSQFQPQPSIQQQEAQQSDFSYEGDSRQTPLNEQYNQRPQWNEPTSQHPAPRMPGLLARPRFNQGPNNPTGQFMNGRGPQDYRPRAPGGNFGNNNYGHRGEGKARRGRGRAR